MSWREKLRDCQFKCSLGMYEKRGLIDDAQLFSKKRGHFFRNGRKLPTLTSFARKMIQRTGGFIIPPPVLIG